MGKLFSRVNNPRLGLLLFEMENEGERESGKSNSMNE